MYSSLLHGGRWALAKECYDERVATQKERLDKHDKQIAAIRTLIQQGMRMLVEDRRLIMNLHKDMRALAAVQKRTEETLQAFIKSRHHGGNGHTKRKIDLQ